MEENKKNKSPLELARPYQREFNEQFARIKEMTPEEFKEYLDNHCNLFCNSGSREFIIGVKSLDLWEDMIKREFGSKTEEE
jgi:hypothetical protein